MLYMTSQHGNKYIPIDTYFQCNWIKFINQNTQSGRMDQKKKKQQPPQKKNQDQNTGCL